MGNPLDLAPEDAIAGEQRMGAKKGGADIIVPDPLPDIGIVRQNAMASGRRLATATATQNRQEQKSCPAHSWPLPREKCAQLAQQPKADGEAGDENQEKRK